MLAQLFPAQVDNRFRGPRAALWLLGLLVALKLVVSLNSILNTAAVAQGADGIPLNSFPPAAARMVLMLFALGAVGQLFVALIALAALVRWRALVPSIFLLLLIEQIARRMVVQTHALPRTGDLSFGWYFNAAMLALLVLGLVLSLAPGRRGPKET